MEFKLIYKLKGRRTYFHQGLDFKLYINPHLIVDEYHLQRMGELLASMAIVGAINLQKYGYAFTYIDYLMGYIKRVDSSFCMMQVTKINMI